ncbi:hypothetical protein HID58_002212, partial [Brassica napus]
MADWGPVVVAVILFVLLTPGLLFQIPARGRVVEFGNMHTSGASILVHTIIYFGLITIFTIAICLHIYAGFCGVKVSSVRIRLREMESKSDAILFVIIHYGHFSSSEAIHLRGRDLYTNESIPFSKHWMTCKVFSAKYINCWSHTFPFFPLLHKNSCVRSMASSNCGVPSS